MSSEASWSGLSLSGNEGKAKLRAWSKGSENLQQVICLKAGEVYCVYVCAPMVNASFIFFSLDRLLPAAYKRVRILHDGPVQFMHPHF